VSGRKKSHEKYGEVMAAKLGLSGALLHLLTRIRANQILQTDAVDELALLRDRVRHFAERLEEFSGFQAERVRGFQSPLGKKIVASLGPGAVQLMGMPKHGTVRLKPADDHVRDWQAAMETVQRNREELVGYEEMLGMIVSALRNDVPARYDL
jgi:hypothetical protein